ncbi:MAG: hypothetical protein IBJ02_08955 [Brevundimonas sp.]|nr:hypothetical protein [Brevundimonas sp.]
MPDRLVLALGRRLPPLLGWLASAIWWVVFIAAVASVWIDLPDQFPDDTTIVPVLIGLTILGMLRRALIHRRNALLANGEQPRSLQD